MDEKKSYLVSARTDNKHPDSPESPFHEPCSECGEEVMISYSSKRVLNKAVLDILCEECYSQKDLTGADIKMAPGSVQEIIDLSNKRKYTKWMKD